VVLTYLQAGNRSIPGGKVLRVLRADSAGRSVRPTEHDRALELATRHVVTLGGAVDDVINGLPLQQLGQQP
jgi:hypothetical protein